MEKNNSLTVIILSRNEENTIVDCIESVSFASEIIVIDDFSTDRTVELSKYHGAKVIPRSLQNDFSAQRNFGLSRAKHEWVLFVDADERVSEDLKNEIIYKIRRRGNKAIVSGFNIKRVDFLFGKKLRFGETGKLWLARLAKKNAGKWVGKVHETWNINGMVEKLESELTHIPHQSIQEFLSDINSYSDIRAKELFETGIQTSRAQILLFPLGKFVLNYFVKRGFLDGSEGLILAFVMSFHSFLTRAKLWQLWQKN